MSLFVRRTEARRMMDAMENPDDPLHEKLERMNELLETKDNVTVTYTPVKWWREKVPVPAWVLVAYLVLQLLHTGQAAVS